MGQGASSSGQQKDDEPVQDAAKETDASKNPPYSEKPLDYFDDLFEDLPENFMFDGFGDELDAAGLGNLFADVSMDSVFHESDCTPAPVEVQQSWLGDVHAEQNDDPRNLFAVRNGRSNVACWMFDKDRQLYLIKRMNGKLEYYKRLQEFYSMPKFDLWSINNAMFFNPSKDSQAELFAKLLKDKCDKDFSVMKTAKGRRFISSCILDPVKKEPWVYYKNPPPATKKAVPIST
ncbi:hypothetical protein R6Q59_010375 [Mikania micrantha]